MRRLIGIIAIFPNVLIVWATLCPCYRSSCESGKPETTFMSHESIGIYPQLKSKHSARDKVQIKEKETSPHIKTLRACSCHTAPVNYA